MTRSIDVLGYEVTVGGGLLNSLGAVCHRVAPAHRYAIISDDQVARHWLGPASGAIASAMPTAKVISTTVPAGEASKTREQWTRLTDWSGAMEDLAARGFTTVALSLAEDAVPVQQAVAGADRLALVLGSEGHGLSSRWQQACRHRAVIPMRAGVDSLNVAAAAAVACWVAVDRS